MAYAIAATLVLLAIVAVAAAAQPIGPSNPLVPNRLATAERRAIIVLGLVAVSLSFAAGAVL